MIAHIRKLDNKTQSLKEHCVQVAYLCEQAAAPLGLARMGFLLGVLHDLGKATCAFQAYLWMVLENAAATSPHHHAPTAAAYVYRRWFCEERADLFQRFTAQILALCLYGHHAGLLDCLNPKGESDFLQAMRTLDKTRHDEEAIGWFFQNVITEQEADALFAEAKQEVQDFVRQRIQKEKDKTARQFDLGMLTRLLLSILVDADRWDSACFDYGEEAEKTLHQADWEALFARFEAFREQHLNAANEMGRIRAEISDGCLERAEEPPGIYTLCVPTGGGKTYTSLRYALRHAARYQKQRIFYIIPYNTILDQNAEDIRKALSDYPSILEHHSNVVKASEEEQTEYRRLTERWNSDIILTSLVQFLNACFAAPNSDARRLYRLTNAVLIFDEIQSLPRHCKTLFERAITFLSTCCGSTVILCTATQPQLALTPMPVELSRERDELFRRLKRVTYVPQLEEALSNEEAAARLLALLDKQAVLAVVNTKRVAQEVYREVIRRLTEWGMNRILPELGCPQEEIRRRARECTQRDVLCVHLSTLLCPAHRGQLLQWIRIFLQEKAKVFCISTALIEAGINVSFPVVVRSLTGLPSIVQAAGRANRSMEYGIGRVYIWSFGEEKLRFLPDIQNGGNLTRTLLQTGSGEDLDRPEEIAAYFRLEQDYTKRCQDYPLKDGLTLYSLLAENQKSVVAAANFRTGKKLVLNQSFRTAYRAFRAIPSATAGVLVPFGKGEELIAQLGRKGSMKEKLFLLRKAQAYSVSLYDSAFRRLNNERAIWEIGDSGVFALEPGYYDEDCGVTLTRQELELMCF